MRVVPYVLFDETPVLVERFTVTNDAPEPVTLTETRQSCGCTAATLDRKSLAPGQAATLELSANLLGRSGPQRFTCDVLDSNGRVRSFEVKTVVYPRGRFSADVVHFGPVQPSTTSRRAVEFYAYGTSDEDLPADVTVSSNSPALAVASGAVETGRTAEGAAFRRLRIDTVLSAPANTGSGSSALQARFAIRGRPAFVDLGIDWIVTSPVVVSPPSVFISRRPGHDGPVEHRVLVRRADNQPLTVRRVISPHPAVAVEVRPEPSGNILVITVTPRTASGFKVGDIRIETDHPSCPSAIVTVALEPD